MANFPEGIEAELVLTFAAYTMLPPVLSTATEYAVAPVDAFQLSVGVRVVTVVPGDVDAPGVRPFGVDGAVGTFTVKYTPVEGLLAPLALDAETDQIYSAPLVRVEVVTEVEETVLV